MSIPLRTLKLHGLDDTYVVPARNLLDNSDFTNPVNQGGKTIYTKDGYCIDRWYATTYGGVFSVTLESGCIHIDQPKDYLRLYQNLENRSKHTGKTVTCAINIDGVVYCYSFVLGSGRGWLIENEVQLHSVDSMDFVLDFYVEKRVYWVALYEGEYTIDTIPEYQPKGYNVELLNCGGYAPSGYGLGENTYDLPISTDADECMLNGWYRIDASTANGIGASGVMRVETYGTGNIVQTAYSGNYTSYGMVIMQRIKRSGSWGEWEWVTPLMQPGVEYRTTERYEGKPVYAYHGTYTLESTLTGNARLEINTGILNLDVCIRKEAKLGYYFLPYIGDNGATAIEGLANSGILVLTNTGSESGWNAGYKLNYTLYYTKTAD